MTDEQNQPQIPDPKKAEAGRKGGLKRQENWRRGVKECEWCGKLSADLNEHPCFIAFDSAATSMRSACIEKVREMGAAWRNEREREKRDHMDHAATLLSAKSEAAFEISRALTMAVIRGESS